MVTCNGLSGSASFRPWKLTWPHTLTLGVMLLDFFFLYINVFREPGNTKNCQQRWNEDFSAPPNPFLLELLSPWLERASSPKAGSDGLVPVLSLFRPLWLLSFSASALIIEGRNGWRMNEPKTLFMFRGNHINHSPGRRCFATRQG